MNVYIICTEDVFLDRCKELNYFENIRYIQWIPAEFLTLNDNILDSLETRYNTKSKSVIRKLGCIAAHRKALLAIFNNRTNNNIILEQDATLEGCLFEIPPDKTCYLGGWIIPPQISKSGKVKVDIHPQNGLNEIDYKKMKILTTHALFIKDYDDALELLQSTLQTKTKNYDVHLCNNKLIKYYYYPSLFYQSDHVSEIDGKNNLNTKRTLNYGLFI